MTKITFGFYQPYCSAMVRCFNSDGRHTYVRRIEKVKFGAPVAEAFCHDIPATLLVLLLKVNKEGPLKKDIWRAPGNQAHVRKLITIMQHGRLVNIDHFSVYTAASVIKKFLSKIPGGIFGAENENRLFDMLNLDEIDKQREAFCRVIASLPANSQHLLVLLFGTFKLVSDGCETFSNRMNAEAIGVSVAPSLFHSCIHDIQRAKIEDVVRFRLASRVVTFVVQNFGRSNLFPREVYEFYARITARTLRVDENYHFTFHYPSRAFNQPQLVITPEDEPSQPPSAYRHLSKSIDIVAHTHAMPLDELKRLNKLAESTKSLSYLEWVHERQTQRMQTRSEWFLSPFPFFTLSLTDARGYACPSSSTGGGGGSAQEKRYSWRKRYLRPLSNLTMGAVGGSKDESDDSHSPLCLHILTPTTTDDEENPLLTVEDRKTASSRSVF